MLIASTQNLEMRNIKEYQEEYEKHHFEEVMVEYRRKLVIEQLSKFKSDHILEIGCGNEPMSKYYDDYVSMTVVEPGINFYNRLQKYCDSRPDKKIITYNALVNDVIEDLKGHKYDFIIISSLLHEVNNAHEILKKIGQLCHSQTIVHINVPNKNSFHRMLALKSGIINSLDEHSISQKKLQQNDFFDIRSLIDLIEDCKYTLIDHGSYFIKPFTHAQMAELLNNKIINRQILDGLFQLSPLLPDYGAEIYVNIKY